MPEINAVLRRPHARIADIGCGAGWSTIALARAYPSAAEFGIDVDEPSIQAAKANAEAARVADRVISPWQGEGLGELAPFDAALLSSALMTCHALSRCWQRSATPSVPTAW
jgi:trans-aconitate methyltransferase